MTAEQKDILVKYFEDSGIMDQYVDEDWNEREEFAKIPAERREVKGGEVLDLYNVSLGYTWTEEGYWDESRSIRDQVMTESGSHKYSPSKKSIKENKEEIKEAAVPKVIVVIENGITNVYSNTNIEVGIVDRDYMLMHKGENDDADAEYDRLEQELESENFKQVF